MITVANNTKASWYSSDDGEVRAEGTVPRFPYGGGYDTPFEYGGTHPVHEPTLTGSAAQLLVLDKNWVIVVLDPIPDLLAEIDTLSSNALTGYINTFQTSIENNNIDFGARTNRWATINTYITDARIDIGENLMLNANYYAITSADDSNYSSAQEPTNVGRVYVPQGPERYVPNPWRQPDGLFLDASGAFQSPYNIYLYLEMPTSLVDGDTYTITLDNGDTVEFLFDDNYTVSRAIKVNQVGYLPDAPKNVAYVGCYLYEHGPLDVSHASTFNVINYDTGVTAYTSTLTLLESNPTLGTGADVPTRLRYGENVYEADFSAMTATGNFYISIPGVGRSWPFRHHADAYSEVYFTCMRGLYHQRNGQDLTNRYSPWCRQRAKIYPYGESEYLDVGNRAYLAVNALGEPEPEVQSPGTTLYSSEDSVFEVNGYTQTKGCITHPPDVVGGHHDAADWDCRWEQYTAVFDCLNAFELYGSKFTGSDLDLPNTGNGIPEMLWEAKHGLDIWKASQDATTGAVRGRLESSTHTTAEAKTQDNTQYYYSYSQPTRFNNLVYAAGAAQFARLVAAYDSSMSTEYQTSAIAAYDWGNDSANGYGTDFVINSATVRGTGTPYTYEYTEHSGEVDIYIMHARMQLFLLTEDTDYLTGVSALRDNDYDKPGVYPWGITDWCPWICYSFIQCDDQHSQLTSDATYFRTYFTDLADVYVADLYDKAYANIWPKEQDRYMAWGASYMPNFNRILAIAYEIDAQADYRACMIHNMDFVLGANPMGQSWTTGLGYVYPYGFQHTVSEETRHFYGISDPVPGVTIYNITNAGPFLRFRATDLGENQVGVWRTLLPGNGAVTSLTQSAGVATCVMSSDHGLSTNDYVWIEDATATEYNSADDYTPIQVTVTATDTFTYSVDSGAASPAGGTPLVHRWWPTDSSQYGDNTIPLWRAYMAHPSFNVGQCEFSTQQMISGIAFAAAALVDTYAAQTVKKPRQAKYVHGRWYLV